MQIVLRQTKHQIGDFHQIFEDLRQDINQYQQGLVVYPELYLTGYPLQDLVLQKEFIENYQMHLNELNTWLKSQALNEEVCILVGGLKYTFDEEGLPLTIENVVYHCELGTGIASIYTKCLLPNYDIFDEEKYFSPGDSATVMTFMNKRIGLLICEDMWFSSTHSIDPVELLRKEVEKSKDLDLIINLSASPYFLGKQEKRITRANEISATFGAPFAYVNRVGGEDEILFDGQSFITNGKDISIATNFSQETLVWAYTPYQGNRTKEDQNKATVENSWESLFKADINMQASPLPQLNEWSEQECEEVIKALSFGLQEYANKCGFNKFLVALSGGIDSGLVLLLAKIALKEGQELEAIYMPSQYSSPLSTQLSQELCDNLGIKLIHFPIKFLHSAVNQEFMRNLSTPLQGLANENIQSRLRGALLYAHSNQTGAMVINTSNKSELAVGYSTLYGDSVGAISMLGDLYKQQVYALSRYLQKRDQLLPIQYIERPPSAELREDQEDSQSLPPYERLDVLLEGFLSYRLSQKKLHELGFVKEEVKKVYDLYRKSEYKRSQFCPIIKVKAKSFGFGYRVPITKKN